MLNPKKTNIKKILSSALCLSMLMTGITSVNVSALENLTNVASYDVKGDKTNFIFLEGTPGDTHLVYTYEQNGNTYKVVENASDDFKKVESIIYLLDANGSFIENSFQESNVDENGNAYVTFKDINGESNTIVANPVDNRQTQSSISPQATDWEWHTYYRDGRTGSLLNLTISVAVSVIAAAVTAGASATGQLIFSGLSGVASYAITNNISSLYFHSVHNWRHSSKNYVVIDETIATNYYYDAGHSVGAGYSYAEYIF